MRQLWIFVVQTTVSWVVLLVLQFVGAAFGPVAYDGAVTIIGTVLINIATNLVVALIGLPLHLIPVTRRWLQRHGPLMMIIATGAIAAVVAGLLLGRPVVVHDEFGRPMRGFEAFAPLYVSGWFLTAFAIVHTWWPRAWTISGAEERDLQRKIARGRALRDSAQS